MTWTDIQLWPLLAGLGLFLFGMFMLEESLKALAGRSFKKFLRRQTGHPVKAVLSGTLVTAVLQSSSMVSLLVMSFAGAGIIGLKNGIGMILGANLGTTMTGWLVSYIGFKLDIGSFILPFIAVGGLGIIFLKSERWSHFSKLLMGFSFMFLGLNYMKNGFAEFSAHIDFTFLQDKPSFLFIAVGVMLAASIQSSSAAMMIFLSSLDAEVITLNQAMLLVIGGDLGTTITAIIATFSGNTIRKKVGWSQFYFNVFSALLAWLFFGLHRWFILEFMSVEDPLIAVVFFHSMFNLVGILATLPYLNLFTRTIDRLVGSNEQKRATHLIHANPKESHAGTEALATEAMDFVREALDVNASFFNIQTEGMADNPNDNYFQLKAYESEITNFYVPLQQNALTADEVERINALVAAVRNATLSAKDLKDIKHNLDQLRTSAQDIYYKFYDQCRSNQMLFYRELDGLLAHKGLVSLAEIEQATGMHQGFYRHETEDFYRITSKVVHPEVDVPSMLNMIREINNSNEALIRAITALLSVKKET